MSLPYYTKMLKALWSNDVLTADEVRGKDVLLIGLSYFGDEALPALQHSFLAADARLDYAPLFNGRMNTNPYLAQLDALAAEKQYDLVVLLEGLEREPHFVKAAEALAKCCRLGGRLLLFAETPDASEEARGLLSRKTGRVRPETVLSGSTAAGVRCADFRVR